MGRVTRDIVITSDSKEKEVNSLNHDSPQYHLFHLDKDLNAK
jgi:hypothetical protein